MIPEHKNEPWKRTKWQMSRRESLQNSASKNILVQCTQSKLSKKKFIHFLITIIENVECQFLPKSITCHQLWLSNKILILFWSQKITWQGIKKIIIILIKKWCYGKHKTDIPLKLTWIWPDLGGLSKMYQGASKLSRTRAEDSRTNSELNSFFCSTIHGPTGTGSA